MSERIETAILAGGCFWVSQDLMRRSEGIVSIRAGWTGGESDNPTEDNPGGHAEAVEIVFNSDSVSYRKILELFFQIHRPDLREDVVGSMYRSEVFYLSDEQRQIADETIADLDAAGFWPGRIVTKVSQAGSFFLADADDQDYLENFPASSRFPKPKVEATSRHEMAT
jgi:peptide-methionine (S)-S-oxide reductase